MKTILKIVGEIIAIFGFLYGLFKAGLISQEIAITIGLIIIAFIFCFEELRRDFHPVKNAIAEMQKWLKEKYKFIPLHEIRPAGFIQENSPLKITDIGEKLLEESGAKKVIDDHYAVFESLINKETPKTAYDVQQGSSRVIGQAEKEDYMKLIKDYAYQHPKFNEMPLELTDIQRVMVLYLRDLYLEKHPEIVLEDESSEK